MTKPASPNDILAILPISRGRALNCSLLRIIPAALLLLVAFSIFSRLNLTPSAVSNRIADYSLLILAIPIFLAGVIIGLNGIRWLATACWPGQLAVVASRCGITFHVGAMPSPEYPTEKLTVRYLFEFDTDELDEDLIYESLLPPEKQMADMLPRIDVAGLNQPLNTRILDLCPGTERDIAAALKPFIDFHRQDRNDDI